MLSENSNLPQKTYFEDRFCTRKDVHKPEQSLQLPDEIKYPVLAQVEAPNPNPPKLGILDTDIIQKKRINIK